MSRLMTKSFFGVSGGFKWPNQSPTTPQYAKLITNAAIKGMPYRLLTI